MYKSCSYLLCFIALFCLVPCWCVAQGGGHRTNDNVFDIDRKLPQKEKLYLHLDRTWYKPGDTIWYKGYLLNESLKASTQSGLVYIEMRNDSNRVVKRQTIKAHNGTTVGDIVLKETLSPGNYTLYAYTNWMRNFSVDHFFTCQVTIAPTGNQYWLINEQQTIDKNRNAAVGLHFSDLTTKNIGFRDLQLSVLDGKNTISKNKVVTDPYGNLNLKFTLPEKKDYKHLFIQAEDISKYADWRKIIIPVQLVRLENTDLQFMPEGGTLLADLPNRVAFKAIGEDGNSVAGIKGEVYNKSQQKVASFGSTHKGMGSFIFTPQTGETYTAKVTYADSTVKNYTLPAVKNTGINIQVENKADQDLLEVRLLATADLLNSGKYYMLIGQTRDSVYYSQHVFIGNKPAVASISTKAFPTGITKLILLDDGNQPVSRRMVFIDHSDELKIKLNSNKVSYGPRDSVSLQLMVTDVAGKPVKGNFSLAVTDDNEVKTPTMGAENMKSYLLLSSDIKGTIEGPDYYFEKGNKDRIEALDDLLLTQGWASYELDHCFGPPPKLQFEPEPQFAVKGNISNVFNKPLADEEIKLKSEFPPFELTTQTDKKGCFNFTDFPELEKIDFRIQATRDFNIGLNVEEFVPPDMEPVHNDITPWYINSDSTFVAYVTNSNKKIIETRRTKPDEIVEQGKSRMLKEVFIRQRHYNPPPAVHLLLDEEDLRNVRTGKKAISLMKLLNQKEKLNQMYKFLVIDETPLIRTQELASVIAQSDINRWLEAYTTADILDIRVERMFMNTKLGETPALCIYVTTNGHSGADLIGTNAYAYHPIPISLPHQFYSPKYVAKTKHTGADWRATIHWEPEIETDDNGKANVSFYTADRAGTYSIVLEGGDMKGNIGYQAQQLKVIR